MRLHPARAVGLLRAPWIPGWAKDPLWRQARSVPSLDLRFADNKSLVDATTGQNLVTFSRASGGTYVDSQGVIRTALDNEPRFDHDPSTGESLGLLVEEQRTNLLLRSEDFSTSWPVSGATVSTNTAIAPDGGLTADSLIETAVNALHYTQQIVSGLTSGASYLLSVYAKANTRSSIELLDPYALVGRTFNLSNGTTSAGQTGVGAPASFAIQPVGNGWYRCSIGVTASGTSTALRITLSNGSTTLYAGDGTSGIYLWGAQLEQGAFPTSYIKTEAATATRAADVASITTLGANVRSLFSQFRSPASGTRPIVSLDDNTANERIELFTSGTDPKLLVTDGGVAQADLDAGAVTANTSTRLAARFTTNDFAASVAGGASVLDASGTMPTVDRIRIGRDQAGNYLNGHIARLAGWDSSLELLSSITQ